jgi:hypothetical protein
VWKSRATTREEDAVYLGYTFYPSIIDLLDCHPKLFIMHKLIEYSSFFASAITALAMCGVLFLSGCRSCEEIDDVAMIRTIIGQAAEHAESHSIGKLMGLSTNDLEVNPGKMDRDRVKGSLFMVFQSLGQFKISYPWPSVNIDPSGVHAEAHIPFVVVRKDVELPDLTGLYKDPEGWSKAASEKADLFELNLILVKQDDEWKVRSAQITGTRGLYSN